jgi:hypothetical protein
LEEITGDEIMAKKTEFSKKLLIQESILIWIITIACIVLAYFCIVNDSYGDLPWLTAIVGLPWGAYGVSQVYYYKKAMAENIKDGIKYDTVMADLARDSVSELNSSEE